MQQPGLFLVVGAVVLSASWAVLGGRGPVAHFTCSEQAEGTPLSVLFDASGSEDPDGRIVICFWTFGDGYTGSGQSVAHTYAQAGCYKVTLMVIAEGEAKDSLSGLIYVPGVEEVYPFGVQVGQAAPEFALPYLDGTIERSRLDDRTVGIARHRPRGEDAVRGCGDTARLRHRPHRSHPILRTSGRPRRRSHRAVVALSRIRIASATESQGEYWLAGPRCSCHISQASRRSSHVKAAFPHEKLRTTPQDQNGTSSSSLGELSSDFSYLNVSV